jgi:serine/threonine-protein kinase
VYDFGVDERGHYLVMEWVDGLSLADYVHAYLQQNLPTPWMMIVAVVSEALRGLGAAHLRTRVGQPAPVVHRDVSPGNVLIGTSGIPKLTDFGLAHAKDRISRLTRPGTLKGKVGYLAPERTIGKPATPRSDLFSMGVTLWEALAGRPLFLGDTTQVLRQIMNGQIEPLINVRSDVPSQVAAAVHRALQPDPQRRYQNALDMAADLAAALKDRKLVSEARIGASVLEARMRLAGLPPPAHAATTPAIGIARAHRKP